VVALSAAFIVPGLLWPKDGLPFLVIGCLVLVLGGWAAGRALWIQLAPPQGRVVSPAEAPALHRAVAELRRRLRAARFDQVLVVPECNAAVMHRPRLGVFGWHRHYLLLGLPLLEGLTPAELTAVLAHECAHLSKEHHRSGQWIYRLRRAWDQEFEKLAKPRNAGEVSLRPVIHKFVQWFWPRFNAYAFVLSRAHEYQADALAAEVAGLEAAATALMRIACHREALDRKFWPELWQETAALAVPPEGVFLRLSRTLSQPDPGREPQRLEQALRAATTNADTHPCLTDRLRALGWSVGAGNSHPAPPALPPVQPSAAEQLLGPALGAIRADVELAWRKEWEPRWRQLHGKANALQERLQRLDHALDARRADTDALWDKARVLLELQDTVGAEPLLRQVLTLDPAHLAANFNLGRLLLKGGKPEGEAFLERAVAQDEELLLQAADVFHSYYRLNGQPERLRALYARLDRFEKDREASRQERSSITVADTLLAHDLTEADLASARETLAALPVIASAHLGRKQLRYAAQQRFYLLCVWLRPRWHRLPDTDLERTVIDRLTATLRLPGRVLVIAPSGVHRALGRKLRQVPGTQIAGA
jgi:Zn-dependent protease with chaperone function